MPTYPIIDTHAHLYGEPFQDDLDAAVERAKGVGVERILLSNVDLESVAEISEVVERHPDICMPMIGLHPTSVEKNYPKQLKELREELEKAPERYVAIGEIGLDYYWSRELVSEQKAAFSTQLEWSSEFQLPVSMHCREAIMDAIEVIKQVGASELRGVFHSFTGSREELEAILELENFMVGINGVVTFKNSNLGEVIRGVLPLERIVVETDCPYLSPVPKRGKRNEPSHLPHIIYKLAEVYEMDEKIVANRIYENSLRQFGLIFSTE